MHCFQYDLYGIKESYLQSLFMVVCYTVEYFFNLRINVDIYIYIKRI